MLDDRKTAILRAVVEEYIATAQPVGSSHIAASHGVQVSSATVRNDMAFLEQEGYLLSRTRLQDVFLQIRATDFL